MGFEKTGWLLLNCDLITNVTYKKWRYFVIFGCSSTFGRIAVVQRYFLYMAAPKGNQFWKLHSKHGRDTLFSTPDLMWEAACEYFQWCDDNPWRVVKNKTKGKIKEKEDSPTQRPYTLSGFLFYHPFLKKAGKRGAVNNLPCSFILHGYFSVSS